MITCEDCKDSACPGMGTPGGACDDYTSEAWDPVDGVPTLELGHAPWDEARIKYLEQHVQTLSEMVLRMERVISAMNKAYMGEAG